MIGWKSSLPDWSRVFRINLFPIYLIPLMIGFLAGGGEFFSPYGFSLSLWSLASFALSFGHNSLVDASSGHDAEEKDPRTHPLVSGKIPLSTAGKVIHFGLPCIAVLGLVLADAGGGNSFLAASFLLVHMVTGYTYNGISKVTRWSFLPISTSFASLCLFGYFAVSENVGSLIPLLVLYVFLTMWFEADFEGGLKDIKSPEIGLMEDLGVRLGIGGVELGAAQVYAWLLKVSSLAVIVYILLSRPFSWPGLTFCMLFCITALVFAYLLISTQRWDRRKIMRWIGGEELSSFSLGIVLVAPRGGWIPSGTIIVFSFLWTFVFSKALYEDLDRVTRAKNHRFGGDGSA